MCVCVGVCADAPTPLQRGAVIPRTREPPAGAGSAARPPETKTPPQPTTHVQHVCRSAPLFQGPRRASLADKQFVNPKHGCTERRNQPPLHTHTHTGTGRPPPTGYWGRGARRDGPGPVVCSAAGRRRSGCPVCAVPPTTYPATAAHFPPPFINTAATRNAATTIAK